MTGRPGQAFPQGDAGLIGPLEVVHDQDRRLVRAQLADEREQLLGQGARHILAVPGRYLAAQQRDDGFLPGVGRGLAHPEAVQDGQQRQGLAQLIARSPENLAAVVRRRSADRTGQRGLADAGLALDEDGFAVPCGRLSHAADKPREFVVPADQLAG